MLKQEFISKSDEIIDTKLSVTIITNFLSYHYSVIIYTGSSSYLCRLFRKPEEMKFESSAIPESGANPSAITQEQAHWLN